jgi:Spy/CpxP family protein refolding chaperone
LVHIVVLVLGVAMLFGRPVSAASRQENAKQMLQQIAKQLNLSEDQKAKIKPILTEEVQQLKALKADTSMTQDQKRSKAMQIRADSSAKITPILTPEQQKKWQEMKAAAKAKHKSGA